MFFNFLLYDMKTKGVFLIYIEFFAEFFVVIGRADADFFFRCFTGMGKYFLGSEGDLLRSMIFCCFVRLKEIWGSFGYIL